MKGSAVAHTGQLQPYADSATAAVKQARQLQP